MCLHTFTPTAVPRAHADQHSWAQPLTFQRTMLWSLQAADIHKLSTATHSIAIAQKHCHSSEGLRMLHYIQHSFKDTGQPRYNKRKRDSRQLHTCWPARVSRLPAALPACCCRLFPVSLALVEVMPVASDTYCTEECSPEMCLPVRMARITSGTPAGEMCSPVISHTWHAPVLHLPCFKRLHVAAGCHAR